MPAKLSSIGFDMAVRSGPQSPAAAREPQGRFNIVVLGDFTGRASRGIVEPLSTRKVPQLDVDNFARVFAQLNARLMLTGATFPGGALDLAFDALDDFHPDRLLAQVPWLSSLAAARTLVSNPATAEQGRAALEACLGSTAAAPVQSHTATTAPEADGDAFASLLGGSLPAKKAAPPATGIDAFIQKTIAPHISAAPGAWQSGAVAAAEMELTSRLKAILHHPDFQALEAAWRGADMLVRRVESSDEIGILVLDASLAELQADLAAQPQAQDSALFRLLRDSNPGLLVGNFTFGHTADELRALGSLAEMGAALSAPFAATATSRLAGCDSFSSHPDPDDWDFHLPEDTAPVWKALRNSPHAPCVGLTAPRFMLRQPHGKTGDPIDAFPFEELPAEPPHESFLWGHSSVLLACAAIDAIQSGDTDLAEFTGGEIDEMPVHNFTEDGEKAVKCYAEAWLTDRAADRILKAGVMPVVPIKNYNVVRLNHLCSVASGAIALRIGR